MKRLEDTELLTSRESSRPGCIPPVYDIEETIDVLPIEERGLLSPT